MSQEKPAAWHEVKLDLRDAMAAAGALMVIGAAAAIHWALALMLAGGVLGFAGVWLARRG